MLVVSLFKCSFSETDVVLCIGCSRVAVRRSRDLSIVDDVGRKAVVVKRALLFRSAITKAFVVVVVVVGG